MNLRDAVAEVSPAVGRGIWNPGAWTPERCAVWWLLGEADRARMVAWVRREGLRGECFADELPTVGV